MHAEGAGAHVQAHRAFPAKFTGFVSGNWLCWHRPWIEWKNSSSKGGKSKASIQTVLPRQYMVLWTPECRGQIPMERPVTGGSLLILGGRGPKPMLRPICPSWAGWPGFKSFLIFLSKTGPLFSRPQKLACCCWLWPSTSLPRAWCIKVQCINTMRSSLNHTLWILSQYSYWKWVLNTEISQHEDPALALTL